jgi:release factor glutamine methyltransferase
VTTTVATALAQARERGVARLDAQLMLARILGAPRSALIAHDDRFVPVEAERRWADWLDRRAGGEPLAYLLGEKEFHGLKLEVNADVLVPRPETELLVDWGAQLIAATPRAAGARAGLASALDLGTGSGAIALALKHLHPSLAVTASDASLPALAVARRNASRLSLAIEFVASSWWQALPGRSFDLVVANPPYVAAADPHLDALRHEPRAALTPGGDGLGALREIVGAAPTHLNEGGWLLVEHGFDQGAAVRGLFAAAGLIDLATQRDLAGHERATGGRRPAPPR